VETQTLNEGGDGLVVGDLRDLEAHIRESSDVIAQRFVLPVPYPFKVVLVPRLLACSDEIVNKSLAELFPRVEGVLGQAEKPLMTVLVKDYGEVVSHDVLISRS